MIKDLEVALGYRFRNITLLQKALTHSNMPMSVGMTA